MNPPIFHRFTLLAILALAAPTQSYALNPTLIGSNPGVAQFCYDANNYIPSNDSPVVGGWTAIYTQNPEGTINYSLPLGYMIRPFGKFCTDRQLTNTTADANYNSDPVAGRKLRYSGASSEWYIGGAAQIVSSCYDCTTVYGAHKEYPAIGMACPPNTAPIRVSGYVRSDGGSMTAPLHAYDIFSNHSSNNRWINSPFDPITHISTTTNGWATGHRLKQNIMFVRKPTRRSKNRHRSSALDIKRRRFGKTSQQY